MREILATWIIFQLLVIGMVGGDLEYEVKNNIYECSNDMSRLEANIYGAIFPLLLFTNNYGINNCNKK